MDDFDSLFGGLDLFNTENNLIEEKTNNKNNNQFKFKNKMKMKKKLYKRKNIDFCGLSNQGGTCYLNSLMQTLFHTLEFRKIVYQYNYNDLHGPIKFCIPYQLQLLFAKLQYSLNGEVKTNSLTKSFGWNEKDSYYQQDVQEFSRVLFDALEKTFINTENSKLSITNLFQGELTSSVQCKICGEISLKKESFLDISLVIENCSTLNDAIINFIQPELLTDDNQYFCEKCNKKVDALKKLGFSKLPEILSIQLKRFTFDIKTMSRIKLNNRVEFNYYLDGDLFLKENIKEKEKGKEKSIDKFMEKPEKNTDNLYELYSILIHRGNSNSGHYFAYIKPNKMDCWYCFNDRKINKIKMNDILKTFGGGVDKKKSSENAYLLMYRKVKKEEEEEDEKDLIYNNLPTNIQEIIQKENEEFLKEYEEYERNLTRISIHYLFKNKQNEITVDQRITIKELTKKIFKKLNLSKNEKTIDCIRLRRYRIDFGIPGGTFEGEEEEMLEKVGIVENTVLFVEIREPNEEFEKIDPNEIILKIRLFNSITEEFDQENNFFISKNETLGKAKEKYLQMNKNQKSKSKIKIKYYGLVDGDEIIVEITDQNNYEESKAIKLYYQKQNTFDILIEYENENEIINFDFRKTLYELKKEISKIFKIDIDKFRIKKSSPIQELKDLNLSLHDLNIFPSTILQIESGIPLTEEEFYFIFYEYDIYSEKMFENEMNFPININWNILELKKEISKKINLENYQSLIIREKEAFKAGKIYSDELLIKDIFSNVNNIHDGKCLIYQIVGKEFENPKKDEILVLIEQYFPERKKMKVDYKTRKEVIFKREMSCINFQKEVANIYNLDQERIQIAKKTGFQNINNYHLLEWEHFKENEIENETICSFFDLNEDGDLIIIKDNSLKENKTKTTRRKSRKSYERELKIYTFFDEKK
ncbi:ubiquitin carboxyl-terminal hydrolase [Anaeramoeba ignava]|uniref:Ubiquitin carboxyl-terminal hydrolase n=1 Tax=Anaeramoeba ignava TaxID=1746090 RepID=A0A9Q0LSW0_ANAIG|nr:ubiquitin carboxyl-terminal hydrolase [Anaeramoeba ignava]